MNDGTVKKIILVEDNPDHAELLSILIKNKMNSVQLIHVNDGEQALLKIGISEFSNGDEFLSPDLILLDLNLPGINGKEVLKKIRSKKRFDEIPICVLTTSTSPDERELMLNIGATAYISKTEVETQIGTKLMEFLN